MEFSYKVSEAEFLLAWRLERKASSRSSLKTALFWIILMLCLLLLYKAFQPGGLQSAASSQMSISQATFNQPPGQATRISDSLEKVGPFLVLAGVWILIVAALVPMRLRHLYCKDPRMQGQFTVNVTKDSISTENTAGTSTKSTWNIYDYWCESKGVIVLMFHSGTYAILSLAGLTEPQRDELRGILSASLPRR